MGTGPNSVAANEGDAIMVNRVLLYVALLLIAGTSVARVQLGKRTDLHSITLHQKIHDLPREGLIHEWLILDLFHVASQWSAEDALQYKGT